MNSTLQETVHKINLAYQTPKTDIIIVTGECPLCVSNQGSFDKYDEYDFDW